MSFYRYDFTTHCLTAVGKIICLVISFVYGWLVGWREKCFFLEEISHCERRERRKKYPEKTPDYRLSEKVSHTVSGPRRDLNP